MFLHSEACMHFFIICVSSNVNWIKKKVMIYKFIYLTSILFFLSFFLFSPSLTSWNMYYVSCDEWKFNQFFMFSFLSCARLRQSLVKLRRKNLRIFSLLQFLSNSNTYMFSWLILHLSILYMCFFYINIWKSRKEIYCL